MLAEIGAQLKGIAQLRLVGSALDIGSIDSIPSVPAAFVIPLREDAQPAPRISANSTQRVTEQFGVVLIERAAGNKVPSLPADTETLRNAVRDQLIGWAPGPGCEPISYIRAQLVDIKPSEIWRLLTFSTAYYIVRPQ